MATLDPGWPELNLLPDPDRIVQLLGALQNPSSGYATLAFPVRKAIADYTRAYALENIGPAWFKHVSHQWRNYAKEKCIFLGEQAGSKRKSDGGSATPVHGLLRAAATLPTRTLRTTTSQTSAEIEDLGDVLVLERPATSNYVCHYPEVARLFEGVRKSVWFSTDQKVGPNRTEFKESMHPIHKMSEVLADLDYSVDTYISQHTYFRPQRLLATLSTLSCAHIDLDYYKEQCGYRGIDADEMKEHVLAKCGKANVPPPSLIVNSGRGLYLKWLWAVPLRSTALPRWKAVEKALLNVFAEFNADAKAILGTQIMRIEGSTNTANRSKVGVIWVNGAAENPGRFDFDQFCDRVLPYTREEARAYKAVMAQCGQYLEACKNENRKNLELRSEWRASLLRERDPHSAKIIEANIAHEYAGEIYANQYAWLLRLADYRHGPEGVPDGGFRDEFCWLTANALAHQTTSPYEIMSAIGQLIPSYTADEVKNKASSVLLRMTKGNLYTPHDSCILAKLAVTESEKKVLGLPSSFGGGTCRSVSPNNGILRGELDVKFGKMIGLTFEAYQSQTLERQREGAKYVNLERRANTEAKIILAIEKLTRVAKTPTVKAIAKEVGVGTSCLYEHYAHLLPKRITDQNRQQARDLHNQGDTPAEIATKLKVNRSTVSRWLK